MKKSREQAIGIFKQAVNLAIQNANHSGNFAATRFTLLADIIQIQCIYFENTDLLNFTLPLGLFRTTRDIAAHNGAKIFAYETDSEKFFTLEFDAEDDQDKFIQLFELMSFKGGRVYSTPDLYLGSSVIDKDYCQEILNFLYEVVHGQFEGV